MWLTGSCEAGRRAGLVAAVLWCGWVTAASGEEVLTPLRVLGEAGFSHAGTMSEIVALSDGQRVISSARDGTARLWDLKTGKELQRYSRPESDSVWGIAVLPGEKELLTAASGGYVTRWELATGKLLKTYKHASTAFRVALRPGGTEFVSTDGGNAAILWNIETGKDVQQFRGHTDSVYTALWLDGGKRLVTGASDGKVKVWNPETGECEKTLEEDFDDVYTMQVSPDGKRFVMCSGDQKLRVFACDSLKVDWEKEFEDDVKVANWSHDGKRIAVAGEDGNLYILDARDGDEIRKIAVPGGYHTPVVFTTDGRELVSGGDQMLFRFDAGSGERLLPELGVPAVREGVTTLAISSAGDRVYAGGAEALVQVWDGATGKGVQRFDLERKAMCLAVSPDGRTLAAGQSNGLIALLSTEEGRTVRELKDSGTIECLQFVGKGTRLITGGTGDKAQLWEVSTGKLLRSFEGHKNDINGLAVSDDEASLVTVSDDKTARLWDMESGKEIRVFEAVKDTLYDVVYLAGSRSFLISPHEPELWGWLAPVRKETVLLTGEELARLVEELAAEEFARRDAATRTLVDQGAKIIPHLENLKPDDPEAVYRLKKVRSDIRHAEIDGEVAELHKFDRDMAALVSDNAGRYWAGTVGSAADCKIVIGEVRDRKVVVLQEIADGHSPRELAFSGDGTVLAAGNRDGTVSLFAVAAPAE